MSIYRINKMLYYYDNSSRKKAILLGYEVLELNIVSFDKISSGSFKVGDLKLFKKSVFKDLRLWDF